MKICIISSMGIFPERIDGPAICIYNLAKSMSKLTGGCHVIAGSRNQKKISKLNEYDISIHPFAKDWGWYKTFDSFGKYLSSPLTPLKLCRRIPIVSKKVYSMIQSIKPDMILYNLAPIDPLYPLPFILHHKKIVQLVRMPVWFPIELAEQSSNYFNIFVGSHLYSLVTKQFNAVITHSIEMKNKIEKELGPKSHCTLIPNGVDINLFGAQRPTQGSSYVNILFTGRLSQEKGVLELLTAATKLPKDTFSRIKITLIGGGTPEYVSMLKGYSDKHGLSNNIIFMGEIDYKDLPSIYNEADIFVLPSYREGFPLTLLEAMASYNAIIASKVGAIPDIIKHNYNGLLFESGDVSMMSSYIDMLTNNESERRRLAKNAHKTALDLDWDNVAKMYIELFNKLLNNKN